MIALVVAATAIGPVRRCEMAQPPAMEPQFLHWLAESAVERSAETAALLAIFRDVVDVDSGEVGPGFRGTREGGGSDHVGGIDDVEDEFEDDEYDGWKGGGSDGVDVFCC